MKPRVFALLSPAVVELYVTDATILCGPILTLKNLRAHLT